LKYLVWTLVVVALAASGCSNPQQARGNLGYSVQTYHQHMRWRRYQQAAKFLIPEDRNAFLGRYDELGDDFKVVSVEVRHVEVEPDGLSASSEVVVEWLKEPDMKVHKEKWSQTWVLVEKIWLLEEEEVKEIKPRKAQ
jgi:hypothetical protein